LILGVALFHQGKLTEAGDYLHRAAMLASPEQHAANPLVTKGGTGAALFHRFALTLWILGYPEQAQTYMEKALTLAHRVAQPHNLLMTIDFALWHAHNLHQGQVWQSLFQEYRALVEKHPFPEFVTMRMTYEGWFSAQTGEHAKGIALLKQGLATWRQMGIFMFSTYLRSWLVEAHLWANQVEQGLAFLAETLTLAEETGEQFWLAELYRLQGELLLAQGRTAAEVEPCFQQALQVARQQQAKSLELRAATSLARLWQQQGRSVEAYQLLAEIYNWFTEGFDTADLMEAKTLLAALADSISALPMKQ
jgi:predicted ATPase